MTSIKILLTIALVVAFIGAVFLAWNQATLSNSQMLGQDVFKLTYQFFLLIVLGGGVSLVYKAYGDKRNEMRSEELREREVNDKKLQREREKAETKLEWQREQAKAELERKIEELRSREERWSCLAGELIETYNGTKRIRRLLRARAFKVRPGLNVGCQSSAPMLQVAAYDEFMQELNDLQLAFEQHKRLAGSDPYLTEAVPDFVENLGSVERYLNKIIEEYEKHFPSFEAEEVSLEDLNLIHLGEYIGPYKAADKFKKEFKEPFLRTLEGLREVIARTWERERGEGPS